MINPLTRLITNLANQKREFVVFAGAGLSKDAGIKTGQDILIETLKLLYMQEKNLADLQDNQNQIIEDWYLAHEKLSKLNYSSLLEELFPGNIQRKEYLKRFFVDVDPGESHIQLANLVAKGTIRFIFTTNFDDLIEKALRDLRLDFDVIYSDEVLSQTKSWDKVEKCRIYKLHGDYNTGKVRNTKSELKNLDPLIAQDFQYIINRHGLIVIGYSGRDEGIMGHFFDRTPYNYPFFWQYRTHHEKTEETKLYYDLIDRYNNEYEREIFFIQNNSASNFLNEINNGIDDIDQFLTSSQIRPFDYKPFIKNHNSKKIRGKSLEFVQKFTDCYENYCTKEDLDEFIKYKFEIFEEFLKSIDFIFCYVNDLLVLNQIEEAQFVIDRITLYSSKSLKGIPEGKEFIRGSSPYLLIMVFGALLLKSGYLSLINQFFNLKLKWRTGKYIDLLSVISYSNKAWTFIAGEKNLKENYFKKYSVFHQHLLPDVCSQSDFNRIDAYIAHYIITNDLSTDWGGGASMFSEDFTEVFFDYFDASIENKDEAAKYVEKLKKNYSINNTSYAFHGHLQGVAQLIEAINYNYSIEQE